MTDAPTAPEELDPLSPKGRMARRLGDMGQTQSQIIRLYNTADEAIQAILVQLEEDVRPHLDMLTLLHKKAASDALENADELQDKGKKSATFITGVVKWLPGRDKLVEHDVAAALAQLRKDRRVTEFSIRPERVLSKDALKEDPDYVKTVPGIEIVSGAGISFTPTRTHIVVADTIKVATSTLNAAKAATKKKGRTSQD